MNAVSRIRANACSCSPVVGSMISESAAPVWTPTQPLQIVSPVHYVEISERLKVNKAFQKGVMDFFRPLKEKAKVAHQALCDAERKHLEPAQRDEARDKGALNAYQQEQERLRREAERRLAEEARKREEAQRLAEAQAYEDAGLPDEAEAVLEQAVEAAPPTIILPTTTPKVEGLSYRQVWKAEVVDLELLVAQAARDDRLLALLQPNPVALGQMARALKGRMKVPGVRVWSEQVAAAKGA